MENENGIQLGGTGIFFTAVMGDRPYCKITVVVPPTATDAEIEHAAERYCKVAATFRDVVQSVVGPGWGSEPIPIAAEAPTFAAFAESGDEAEDLTAIVTRYNIKKGADF